MASLSAAFNVGSGSASGLVKSATTLEKEIATFNDEEARLTYENSAKTSADLQAYTDYLNNRINTLKSTGTVVDATKALTMSQDVISATHSNISADIQRENINLMAGGISGTPAGYQSKMDVVESEYSRALSIGDDALAQSLESQFYSLSQSYQSSVQAANTAASTLAKASTTSGSASYEGSVVTNLNEALKSFQGTAKNLSENELNTDLASFAKQNAATLGTLGVKIQSSQPNYWDVVSGIAGAIYNAKVLQAQAESITNPLVSATYAQEAQDYLTGATKFSTLAGDLTAQQIAEAQVNPAMFAYDNTTGTYKQTTQTGYQYINETSADGTTSKVLAPTFSGIVGQAQANKVYFLSPTQTAQMTKLGMNFTENISAKSVANTPNGPSGTTGDGVEAQLNENSPQWLQKLVGKNGIINIYTENNNTGTATNNGFIQFKAQSSSGQGESFYTIATDSKGLTGLYEHLPDGSTQLTGGDYGFDASAVNLLINQAQQTQATIAMQTAATQAKLQAALKIPTIQAAPAPAAPHTAAPALQQTVAPQLTFNPQQASPKAAQILQPTVNPQQTGGGAGLNQSGSGGIKLGQSSGPSIRL